MTPDQIAAVFAGATADSLTDAERALRPIESFGLYQLALHRLAAHCRRVVEIGTWKGYCTEYIAAGLPEDGVVVTVDIAPMRFGPPWGHMILSVGSDSARAAVLDVGPVDLLFLDGGHAYAQIAADYAAWAPKVRPGGIILFDDTTNPACPGVGEWLAEQSFPVHDVSHLHPPSGMAYYCVPDLKENPMHDDPIPADATPPVPAPVPSSPAVTKPEEAPTEVEGVDTPGPAPR